MRNKLMATIYFVILFCVIAQLSAAQTSPTYDDKTPPAYSWGSSTGIKPQQSGSPTKDDHTIINNISVTVDNVEESLKSKTSDKSVTEVSEDILTKITDNHSEMSDTLATITSDIEDVGDRLKSRTSDKNVTEVTEEILAAVGSNSADINGIAGLLKGEDASGTHSIYDKICKIDEVYTLLDESLIAKINTIADYLNGTSDSTQAALIKAISDELASNTVELTNIGNHLYYTPEDSEEAIDIARLANDILVAVYTQDGEEKKSIADLVRDIPQTDLTNTNNLISSNTEKIDSLLTAVNYSNGSDTFSVADIVYDISESVKNLDFSGSMSIDISETNSLIASNTDKLVATVTYTVPGMGDGSSDTAEVQSISQILARQFGDMINNSSYSYDESGNPYESYSVPPICRFLCDLDNLLYKILDAYLTCEIVKDGRTKTVSALFSDNLIEESEGSDSFSSTIGIADELISREPIQIAATYSRSLTVADGLFTDKDGNPTHVLGRILNAVENGSSTSSSGSADLSKLERAVGVVLNEGSDGDKGEPPEVYIKLVDMFYDKGTGIGDFGFRGDDSAYLDEGVSIYDMTKAGLFGQDKNGNTVPLLKEMLSVSYSADSSMPKMADVVYSIDSKIPQNAIASITQETFSSRNHLGNIYTSLGTLDARVATLTNELITLPSKGMGITAGIAIGTSAVEFGGSAYPSKALQGWHRQFIEIISDEGDDGEFKIAFDASGDTRNVKGRILLNIDKTQHVWISADSSSTVTVTEGWR